MINLYTNTSIDLSFGYSFEWLLHLLIGESVNKPS